MDFVLHTRRVSGHIWQVASPRSRKDTAWRRSEAADQLDSTSATNMWTSGVQVHFPYIVCTLYTATAQLLIFHFNWISVWRHDGRQDILAIFKKKSFMMPLNTPENIAKKERSSGTSSTMKATVVHFRGKERKGWGLTLKHVTGHSSAYGNKEIAPIV